MPRHEPRSLTLTVRLTPAEAERLDALRGAVSRADYVRSAALPPESPPPAGVSTPGVPAPPARPDPTHRHRPVAVRDRRWEGGDVYGAPVCACGAVLPHRRLGPVERTLPVG